MKLKIEIDESIEEDEIVIHCKTLSDEITSLQKMIQNQIPKQHIVFYKEDIEFYLPIHSILFFETLDNVLQAHTYDDVYTVQYKLYELEILLPNYFVRVSKSTILNVRQVLSVDRNITSSSLVTFRGSYKQVYVSRFYYKQFKYILNEKRYK